MTHLEQALVLANVDRKWYIIMFLRSIQFATLRMGSLKGRCTWYVTFSDLRILCATSELGCSCFKFQEVRLSRKLTVTLMFIRKL